MFDFWHLTLPLVMPMSLLGLQDPPSKILITSVSKDKSRKETEKVSVFSSVLIVMQKIIYVRKERSN